MKLYEINAALEDLLNKVDPETGEIQFDPQELDDLQLMREQKLEGMALVCKNLDAEAEAIKAEVERLEKRRQSIQKHKDSLFRYLQEQLAGEKIETPRVMVTYRTSEAVDLDEALFWATNDDLSYVRMANPQPDKTKIKAALKQGIEIPGARLVKKSNMSIK